MQFIQPTETRYDLERLPSESLIINGTPMEELVPGFRTLSVGGRELRGRNINAINRQGNDGAIFLDSKLEPRVLPVRYKLTAQDNAEFRYLFNKMNALLQREQLSIRVLDEPEYSYTGTLESVSDVPQGRNIVVSDLTLFCADPYKYKDAVTVNGTNTVDILMDTFYDTYPQEITITPTNSTSTLTIRNGNKEIKLVDGSFVGGQPVVIRFGDDITVTNQNGSMTDKIALHSDLENFTLNKGDTVQFVEGGQISIKVSQVML